MEFDRCVQPDRCNGCLVELRRSGIPAPMPGTDDCLLVISVAPLSSWRCGRAPPVVILQGRNRKEALQWLNLKSHDSIPPLSCERRPGKKNHPIGAEGSLLFAGRSRGLGFLSPEGPRKVTVVSQAGKEATIALLSAGDFVGEEALAAMPGLRLATATAITACTTLKISREEMIRVMHVGA